MILAVGQAFYYLFEDDTCNLLTTFFFFFFLSISTYWFCNFCVSCYGILQNNTIKPRLFIEIADYRKQLWEWTRDRRAL